ncbi:Cytochrome c oxidase subunit 5A [Orbilia oligospora]|uniref:Cytochrome c oxidase polypeptide V n=1 Tax=Orbilia oligospora TaxID=2813651 RepID=A0A6G1LXK8_ORBOL|nr:Cytochrome c oxidase subunit 5A [Orbilia oligospora]KAF3195578.1 Cytochrome c oxidase subunit 5A [Orbilia oligospora]KAF3197462.1 Cytochrome c oxidase subunit 5A [Orbilia oligospora]KAF3198762.1 Cytochrome c oxidase subunit 5A [Orbilia oligospora]KAF3235471.1 Cytochrome c oxidase subunit 5A [Orbilia oligospora]
MSFLRAKTTASSLLRLTPSRSAAIIPRVAVATPQCLPKRDASTAPSHAVSAPTLADIEKRWENMPPQEQAELWMALRDRMKGSWADLTLAEKKASYWIAFGPHGPRRGDPPGENWYVFKGTVGVLILTGVIFFGGHALSAKPAPKTMTKEWQEMSNEYLKEQKSEPITGFSSPDYKGPGMVQSK